MCAAAQWRLEEELSRASCSPWFMGQRPIPAGFCLVAAAMNEGPLCWEQGEASEPAVPPPQPIAEMSLARHSDPRRTAVSGSNTLTRLFFTYSLYGLDFEQT
jgi:hypothetical protein